MGWTDGVIFLGVFAAWFVLTRWVFPWLGIPTCMSGGCSLSSRAGATDESSESAGLKGDRP